MLGATGDGWGATRGTGEAPSPLPKVSPGEVAGLAGSGVGAPRPRRLGWNSSGHTALETRPSFCSRNDVVKFNKENP